MDDRTPTWDLAVLVCCNQRPEGSRRGCCGREPGEALVGWLRDRSRADGLKHRMVIHRTGCLDACAGGTSVALLSASERSIVKVGPEDREAVWARVCDVLERPVTR
ncbi:MAG: hypothetical protein H6736_07635 [Alphaproteobacteria bacterium]|nr:hypothetical protein [Alphaproteobacteria bacterium]MCB9691671.1 hypothetical protein [Alphaproteobacteria bacterium]